MLFTMPLPLETELVHLIKEARTIALATNEPLSSIHLFFAFETMPNLGRDFLDHLSICPTNFIEAYKYSSLPPEAKAEDFDAILDDVDQAALRFDAQKSNTLHLLFAMLNQPSLACQIIGTKLNILAIRAQLLANLTAAPAFKLRSRLGGIDPRPRKSTLYPALKRSYAYEPGQDKLIGK